MTAPSVHTILAVDAPPVPWATVLIIAAGAYGFKAAGWFGLGSVLRRPMPGAIAGLLPASLLFALVAVMTFSGETTNTLAIDERLAGVGVGAVAAWKGAPFWLVVTLAAAVTAVLRQAG